MSESLFWPAPSPESLQAGPRRPLERVDAAALFSMAALRRAWLKIKAAGGGPGIDGMSLGKFEKELDDNLARLRRDILAGDYRPQPVKRLLAPKRKGGLRPLALWSLRDKVAQRVVYDCIEPYFESRFLGCSFGFRPGRGRNDVVKAIVAQRQANRRWVADIDIKACFDNLDTKLVLKLVRQRVRDRLIIGLIRAWLNARVFNELSGQSGLAGASQGAVISPLLANVVLHQVDMRLVQQKYHLIRYADDMVICCRRKQKAEQALEATAAVLGKVKLELNPHKSRVVHFDQGFKFIGVFFVGNRHYVL